LTFVVTGEFDCISRDNVEAMIERFGGRYVTGVSGKVNYLVVGRVLQDGRPPETSKKYRDAEDKGVKILREAEFEEMIKEKTGDSTFTLNGKQKTPRSIPKEESKVLSPIKSTGTEMWTDLYQPKCKADLVGNEGLVD
jgi:replication factor C subunit 1